MTPKTRVKELLLNPIHSDVRSIAALERKLGISNGTINKWDKFAPSSAYAEAVANYFGVSVDYLLGNTDEPTTKRTPDEMTPLELDKALSEEGVVMFDGKPLSEGYKKAILNVIQTMREDK